MATLISCSIIVGKMFDLNFIYIMFLDDYEMIRQHMKRYIETGSTNTPCHGRGQRNSRKNSRFDESEEAKFENLKVTRIFRFGNRQVFPVNNVYVFCMLPCRLDVFYIPVQANWQYTI